MRSFAIHSFRMIHQTSVCKKEREDIAFSVHVKSKWWVVHRRQLPYSLKLRRERSGFALRSATGHGSPTYVNAHIGSKHSISESRFRCQELSMLDHCHGDLLPPMMAEANQVVANKEPVKRLPKPKDPIKQRSKKSTCRFSSRRPGVSPTSFTSFSAFQPDLYLP